MCLPCTVVHMDHVQLMRCVKETLPVTELWEVCHRCRFSGVQASRVSPHTPYVPIKSRDTATSTFPSVRVFVEAFVNIMIMTVPGVRVHNPCVCVHPPTVS